MDNTLLQIISLIVNLSNENVALKQRLTQLEQQNAQVVDLDAIRKAEA